MVVQNPRHGRADIHERPALSHHIARAINGRDGFVQAKAVSVGVATARAHEIVPCQWLLVIITGTRPVAQGVRVYSVYACSRGHEGASLRAPSGCSDVSNPSGRFDLTCGTRRPTRLVPWQRGLGDSWIPNEMPTSSLYARHDQPSERQSAARGFEPPHPISTRLDMYVRGSPAQDGGRPAPRTAAEHTGGPKFERSSRVDGFG